MNFVKFILLILICAFSFKLNAQSNPELFVVIQKSDGCIVCVSNHDRWMKDIAPHYSNGEILFLINDLTNNNTVTMSKTQLDSYGIYDPISIYIEPGKVYVIDAGTKKIVDELDISEGTDNVLKTLNSRSPNLPPINSN